MPSWTSSDNSKIHYTHHGAQAGRETLVLLPGLLGAIKTQWQNFVPILSQHYNVLLVDLRGHGQSENNQPTLNPEQMSADILGLCNFLGITRFHVAGYSLGGYLGLLLALKAPNRVSSVLAHATKFYWNTEALDRLKKQLDPDTIIAKAPNYANQLADEHGGGRWRALVRQGLDLTALIWQKGLTEEAVSAIHCPVLISVGDRDELVPLPEAFQLSRALPKGALLVLPGVRHPFATVQPALILTMMQLFHLPPA